MTNQELRNLVAKSILLSPETRSLIEEKLETLSEDQKSQLESMLVSAQEKQDQFMKQAFEADPELLKKIQDHLHKAILASIKEKEEVSRGEEAKTLSDLEEELDNLFE